MAIVSAEPSNQGGQYLLRLGRGLHSTRLTGGTSYGPYPEADVAPRMAELIDQLRGEGFLRSGLHALFAALQDPDSAVRARAAARIGWRRDPEAVDPLLAALPRAVDDVCAILDALGAIGDAKAVPVLRDYAGRKLLSRRRSAVEALRLLEDEVGLEEANQRARERLLPAVREALDGADEERLTRAILALDAQQKCLALDTLYELAAPLAVRVVRAILGQTAFAQPHVWRYVKSVFKRSMLRHDFRTFGEVAHAIEAQGRTTTGTTASLKSGYDGVERVTNFFRQKTQHFLRRLAWRYLRRLAFHRPELYAHAAAEALIPYGPEDAEPTHGLYGPYAGCYLLNRIVYGASHLVNRVAFGSAQRLVLDPRRLLFRFVNARAMRPPAGAREESYSNLWDAEPRAYLRVLGAARLPEAHVFAVRALSVQRMKEAVLMTADHEEVIALLKAPYEPTVELGLEELDRRFDPQRPDWKLLALVLGDERRITQDRAWRWVALTASLWTRDAERIMAFLAAAHPGLRGMVIELAADHLRALPDVRKPLALWMLQMLRRAESKPGDHEPFAQLARLILLGEMDAVLTLDDVLTLVAGASASAQLIGGELLGRRPDAIGELGTERLTALAQHEVAAVRAAAHKLLRGAVPALRADPAPLFALVESEWADTRNLAFELLRDQIGFESLGLDGIIGLVDSNRADVQSVGREMVTKHFAALPSAEVIGRLVQHPAASMRPFTIELVLEHLPPGAAPLEQVQDFCRAALFDVWPSRAVKRRVIDLLARRGLQDEEQAKVAAKLLGEVVRVQTRGDFERALEALVRLKLAYPELMTAIQLRTEGVA